MTARYRFTCRGCGFHCISSFGGERDVHFTYVVKFCQKCHSVARYTIPNSLGFVERLTCDQCCEPDSLQDWDGMTCPLCGKGLHASGRDVDRFD
jgi:hypothetical protein